MDRMGLKSGDVVYTTHSMFYSPAKEVLPGIFRTTFREYLDCGNAKLAGFGGVIFYDLIFLTIGDAIAARIAQNHAVIARLAEENQELIAEHQKTQAPSLKG